MAFNSEEILILVAAIFGGITFASLITLLIARCLGLFDKFFDKYFPEVKEKDEFLMKQKTSTGSSVNFFGRVVPGVPSRTIPSFKIPGKIKLPTFQVQPVINERPDSQSSSSGPDELRTDDNKPRSRSASIVELEECDPNTTPLMLQPELYRDTRRTTIGSGNLGKVRFALQYEDKSRRNLKLILHRLEGVQYTRIDVVNIFVNILLLPERDAIHKSKLHYKTPNPTYEDEFLFTSRPMNRDFESKSLRFVVQLLDRSGKEHEYGEARMPLLSREIYSQVETDLSLNIKPIPQQNEVGDIMIQMSYSFGKQILSVAVKSIKFPNQHTTENLSAIYFRSYIKRNGEKIGRKHSFQTNVQPGGLIYFDATQHGDFKLKKEYFNESSFRVTIIGKHKVLRKNLTLGKVFMGNCSRDESGIIHWRTILSSPELTWTVWHPIYSS